MTSYHCLLPPRTRGWSWFWGRLCQRPAQWESTKKLKIAQSLICPVRAEWAWSISSLRIFVQAAEVPDFRILSRLISSIFSPPFLVLIFAIPALAFLCYHRGLPDPAVPPLNETASNTSAGKYPAHAVPRTYPYPWPSWAMAMTHFHSALEEFVHAKCSCDYLDGMSHKNVSIGTLGWQMSTSMWLTSDKIWTEFIRAWKRSSCLAHAAGTPGIA